MTDLRQQNSMAWYEVMTIWILPKPSAEAQFYYGVGYMKAIGSSICSAYSATFLSNKVMKRMNGYSQLIIEAA